MMNNLYNQVTDEAEERLIRQRSQVKPDKDSADFITSSMPP